MTTANPFLNPAAPSKESVLAAWEAANKALAKAKEAEIELRNKVIEAWYPAHKEEGTENIELAAGYKLKAVFKVNRTLADRDKVDAALTKIEKLGGVEGKIIAERLIQWKPSLNKKEYDILTDKYRKVIDEVLTIKPGAPSLEIVEPKSKK